MRYCRDLALSNVSRVSEGQRLRHRAVRFGAAQFGYWRGLMPTSTETKQFSNSSATTAACTLTGGRNAFTCAATFGGGSVTLQVLAGDGTTWLNVSSQTAANHVTVDLTPGSYRIAIATATAVFVNLGRVPS